MDTFNHIKSQDWRLACRLGNVAAVEELLTEGYDPAYKDDSKANGLIDALIGASDGHDTYDVVVRLVLALELKYENDPSTLRAVFKESLDWAGIDDVKNKAAYQVIKSAWHRADAASPAQDEPIIAESTAALDLSPLDHTITEDLLRTEMSDGKTWIEHLARQGRLGEVFNARNWAGRSAEMMEVWEQVPDDYRDQINIDGIRIKLQFRIGLQSQESAHDRHER